VIQNDIQEWFIKIPAGVDIGAVLLRVEADCPKQARECEKPLPKNNPKTAKETSEKHAKKGIDDKPVALMALSTHNRVLILS